MAAGVDRNPLTHSCTNLWSVGSLVVAPSPRRAALVSGAPVLYQPVLIWDAGESRLLAETQVRANDSFSLSAALHRNGHIHASSTGRWLFRTFRGVFMSEMGPHPVNEDQIL